MEKYDFIKRNEAVKATIAKADAAYKGKPAAKKKALYQAGNAAAARYTFDTINQEDFNLNTLSVRQLVQAIKDLNLKETLPEIKEEDKIAQNLGDLILTGQKKIVEYQKYRQKKDSKPNSPQSLEAMEYLINALYFYRTEQIKDEAGKFDEKDPTLTALLSVGQEIHNDYLLVKPKEETRPEKPVKLNKQPEDEKQKAEIAAEEKAEPKKVAIAEPQPVSQKEENAPETIPEKEEQSKMTENLSEEEKIEPAPLPEEEKTEEVGDEKKLFIVNMGEEEEENRAFVIHEGEEDKKEEADAFVINEGVEDEDEDTHTFVINEGEDYAFGNAFKVNQAEGEDDEQSNKQNYIAPEDRIYKKTPKENVSLEDAYLNPNRLSNLGLELRKVELPEEPAVKSYDILDKATHDKEGNLRIENDHEVSLNSDKLKSFILTVQAARAAGSDSLVIGKLSSSPESAKKFAANLILAGAIEGMPVVTPYKLEELAAVNPKIEILIEKKRIRAEMSQLRNNLKAAQAEGDTAKITAAETALNTAKIKALEYHLAKGSVDARLDYETAEQRLERLKTVLKKQQDTDVEPRFQRDSEGRVIRDAANTPLRDESVGEYKERNITRKQQTDVLSKVVAAHSK